MHRNSDQRLNTVFTCTWKDWPLANSSLSNYLCPWPVLGVDTSNTTGTTGVKLKLMLHLLISAIALAAANLVCAEALFMIVYRVLSTTNVAAIVAERKRGEIHFRSSTLGHTGGNQWHRHFWVNSIITFVISGHHSVTGPATFRLRDEQFT